MGRWQPRESEALAVGIALADACGMVIVASLVFVPLLVYLVYAIWRPERF